MLRNKIPHRAWSNAQEIDLLPKKCYLAVLLVNRLGWPFIQNEIPFLLASEKLDEITDFMQKLIPTRNYELEGKRHSNHPIFEDNEITIHRKCFPGMNINLKFIIKLRAIYISNKRKEQDKHTMHQQTAGVWN